MGPDNDFSYSTEKLLKAVVLVINLLTFSSKSSFLCPLCSSGAGPYKHFSSASWLNVKFVNSALEEHYSMKGRFSFWFYCTVACLLLRQAAPSNMKDTLTALHLQQGSAECLWVASQKILLEPQLAPSECGTGAQQEVFQQVLLILSREFPKC